MHPRTPAHAPSCTCPQARALMHHKCVTLTGIGKPCRDVFLAVEACHMQGHPAHPSSTCLTAQQCTPAHPTAQAAMVAPHDSPHGSPVPAHLCPPSATSSPASFFMRYSANGAWAMSTAHCKGVLPGTPSGGTASDVGTHSPCDKRQQNP